MGEWKRGDRGEALMLAGWATAGMANRTYHRSHLNYGRMEHHHRHAYHTVKREIAFHGFFLYIFF